MFRIESGSQAVLDRPPPGNHLADNIRFGYNPDNVLPPSLGRGERRLNHENQSCRYFFGDIRSQPRAIIPASGSPVFISFTAEEPELRQEIGDEVELVSSDPVMDELRMVKEPEEIELMRKAQSIAAQGMDRAKELLHPGVTGHAIATEVLYTMMKADAEETSTPIGA